MLNVLRRWWDTRKEDEKDKAYRAGYIWASQELANDVPVEDIAAHTWGNADWFDQGANRCLRDHFIREAEANREDRS